MKSKDITTYMIVIVMVIVALGVGLSTRKGKVVEKPTAKKGVVKVAKAGFLGDAGEEVTENEGIIEIDESGVKDGKMKSFNFYSEKEKKTIYFFIVKASDDSYRVAASACEVCFESMKGFSQVGELIRCENCQVTYSKDQVALEKGGCNPRPIDKNAKVVDGKLLINVTDVEASADLF